MSNLPKYSDSMLIRLRPADREVITARATREGLTVSEYMRRAGLGTLERTPVPRLPASETAAIVAASVKANAAPPLSRYLSSAPGDDPA